MINKHHPNIILLIAISLITTSNSLIANQKQLPKTHALLQSDKSLKIICFGDSVTGVYYHSGSRRAYTDMLGIALKKSYPQAKLTMINAGISGHTTVNAISRIKKDVLKHQPTLVTIMFGLNDMTRVPLEKYEANLKSIVQQCRSIDAEVLLCTPNSVVSTSGRPTKKLIAYCEVVRKVSKELHVPLCDCYEQMQQIRNKNEQDWKLLMSDTIHPNMDGHKRMAEMIAKSITGKTVSLADVTPLEPVLAKTKSRLQAKQPIKIIAMPPLDILIQQAFKEIVPTAKLEVILWSTQGKSLKQIHADARTLVRRTKPDLVLIAIPHDAKTDSVDSLASSYSGIMNSALNFGKPTWDCIVVHPLVITPGKTNTKYDKMIRRIVGAQDLFLIDRPSDQKETAKKIVTDWLKKQLN